MYLKHWNLAKRPFTTSFEPELVFFHQSLADVYHSLTLASKLFPEIIWILGPAGSGKTTALRCLQAGTENEVRLSYIPGGFVTSRGHLDEMLGTSNNAEAPSDDHNLENRLHSCFLRNHQPVQPIIIAFDDADKVDDEEIILELMDLHYLSTDRGWHLTVILSGKNTSPALAPTPLRPARVLELLEPSDEEARKLVEHRLNTCGARKRIFSRPALSAAIAEADGNITRLMAICDLCLQIGYERGRSTIDQKLVQEDVLPLFNKMEKSSESLRHSIENQRAEEKEAAIWSGYDTINQRAHGKFETDETTHDRKRLRHLQVIHDREEERDYGADEEELAGSPEIVEDSYLGVEEDLEEKPEQASDVESAVSASMQSSPALEDVESNEDQKRTQRGGEESTSPLEAPRRIFFPANIRTYLRGTGEAEQPAEKGSTSAPIRKASEFAYAKMAPETLYDSGVRLMGDVLARLRRLEFVDLDPVSSFAAAISKNLSLNLGVLKFAISERGKYDLETHLVNVAILSMACGSKLGLSEKETTNLGEIALMHDIGHLHSNEELLLSENRFNREDFKTIKHHPIVGHDLILEHTNGSQLTAEVILQEHERDDGLGYPNYLAGDEIHYFAKIIGVCDVFEALTHSRAHRTALTPEDALVEIGTTMLRRTDPRIITALRATMRQALRNR